jgi:hypothetical protein
MWPKIPSVAMTKTSHIKPYDRFFHNTQYSNNLPSKFLLSRLSK